MKTAAELAAETGVTRRTIDRWVRRGFIPAPTFRPSPLGHGALALWPDWIVDACIAIRDGEAPPVARLLTRPAPTRLDWPLQRLEASASELGEGIELALSDFESAEVEALIREGIATRLNQLLATVVPPRRLMAQLRRRLVFAEAIRVHRTGVNPVLVFDGRDSYVAGDFLVGERFRVDAQMQPTTLIAIPLFELMCSALEAIGRPRLADPVVEPMRRIVLRGGRQARQIPYHPIGVRRVRFDTESGTPLDEEE